MASCVVAVQTHHHNGCFKHSPFEASPSSSTIASSRSFCPLHHHHHHYHGLLSSSLLPPPARSRVVKGSVHVQASAGPDASKEQSQFGLGGPGTWFGFGKRQGRAVGRLATDTEDETSDTEDETSSGATGDCCYTDSGASTNVVSSIENPTKATNRIIALTSAAAAVGLFLATRGGFSGATLGELAAAALPYDEALSNGRPTVLEFYADWCEVCREMAPDVYKVEQQYKGVVNFVMLNVDNTKWEQELDEFGVEGIPHFAFLDKQGNEEGNIVGRLPKKYLEDNVVALSKGEEKLPHSRIIGQFSNPELHQAPRVSEPRSHGV